MLYFLYSLFKMIPTQIFSSFSQDNMAAKYGILTTTLELTQVNFLMRTDLLSKERAQKHTERTFL